MIMWFIISLILGLAIGGLVYVIAKFFLDDFNKGVNDDEKSQE